MKNYRNHILSVILILYLTFSFSFNSFSQWTQISGYYGGVVNCFTSQGSNFYAGTEGGIFMTSDNGNTWTSVNSGLNNASQLYVMSMASFAGTLYAGTQLDLFKSTNQGTNWTKINKKPADSFVVSIIAKDTSIIIGCNTGAYITYDNGNHWAATNSGLSNAHIQAMTSNNNIILAGTADGAYLSTNNGLVWDSLNPYLMKDANIQAVIIINDTTFIAGSDNGIYRTVDRGLHWESISAGISLPRVYSTSFLYNGTYLIAGVDGGVFYSTDLGNSWTVDTVGLTDYSINAISYYGTNYYVGTNGGVFISSDLTKPWKMILNSGLRNAIILSSNGNGSLVFAGTEGAGLFVSFDNGNNWSQVYTGVPINAYVNSIAMEGTNIFAGTNTGVYYSPNSGSSWSQVNGTHPNDLYDPNVYCLLTYNNNIFAGVDIEGIFLSKDNGANWKKVGGTLHPNQPTFCLANLDSNIFAGTTGGVSWTNDYGSNWHDVDSGFSGQPAYKTLAAGNNDLYVGAQNSGIYITKDLGKYWADIVSNLTYYDIRSIATRDIDVFIATSNGVYWSINEGSVWNADDGSGLSSNDIINICVVGNYIYAGTRGDGLWKRAINEIIPSSIPENKIQTISKLYPNPANDMVRIKLDAPTTISTSIQILNLLGDIVYRNSFANSSDISLNTSKLSPGVYMVKIQSGDEYSNLKLVIER